ncbi:MAG: hypothetical protein MK078_12160 [Crocinitomicaceae bacterium]|nr:hypothetical protein [Crocinitomicaceae bacterium]
MRRGILTVFFLAIVGSNIPYAQDAKFQSGYVIDQNQDTIFGQIRVYRNQIIRTSTLPVIFKSERFIFKKRFGPNEILGYGINNEHYISLAVSTRVDKLKITHAIDESSQ